MFAVRACIYTDDDFGYDDPEFNLKDDEENTFYFNNRNDAVNALIMSFHNLKNSLRPYGRYNIKGWIDSIDERIELISSKFKTFTIKKDFGNQYILYELLEVNKVELSNGSYYYNISDTDIDFSWYEEETIKWDELKNFPDVQ